MLHIQKNGETENHKESRYIYLTFTQMQTSKKLIVTLLLLSVFISCTKENLNEELSDQNAVNYYFNGKSIAKEDINSTEDLNYIYQPGVVNVFDNDQQYEAYLHNWADKLPDTDLQKTILLNAIQSNRIASKIANIAQQKQLTQDSELPDEIITLYQKLEKSKTQNMKTFGLTVVLYKDSDFGGGLKTTPGVVPSLNKKWRNKVSSLKAFGAGALTLCDKRFFRGSKRFYAIATYYEDPFLSATGFDNRLESFF